MKLFVSGRIDDVDAVHKVQQALVNAGHEITHDWTVTEDDSGKFLDSRDEKLANLVETRRRAHADIQGVVDCSAYVICTGNKTMGKGMYVELGAALGLNVKTGSPKLFLLGPMNHMSLFYMHPAITHCESVNEVIAALAE